MGIKLKDKVAIVTGGGTGIGEAICKKFAREGAKILINGLSGDPIKDVAKAIADDGGEAITFEGDVSDEAAARGCVDTAIKRYGKLDILINNAGVLLANAETDDMPIEMFDEHIRCNVRSAFLMTKYALPHLRKTRGNVISAGSEGGVNGQPRNTPYGGTKAFLHAFSDGRRRGTSAIRSARQLCRPRPDRYRLDTQGNRCGRCQGRESVTELRAVRATRNACGSCQCLCLSCVGRCQLCHRRGLVGGWWDDSSEKRSRGIG